MSIHIAAQDGSSVCGGEGSTKVSPPRGDRCPLCLRLLREQTKIDKKEKQVQEEINGILASRHAKAERRKARYLLLHPKRPKDINGV